VFAQINVAMATVVAASRTCPYLRMLFFMLFESVVSLSPVVQATSTGCR
jgi:hypothetical protein